MWYLTAHQAVEPRVGRVHMGPQELETQKTREGEDASHGCLCRAVRLDENEHSGQEYSPTTLDHLIVVQVGAWVRITGGQRWCNLCRAANYQWRVAPYVLTQSGHLFTSLAVFSLPKKQQN